MNKESNHDEEPKQEPNNKPSETPDRGQFSTPLRESGYPPPSTKQDKTDNNDDGEPIFREKE